MHSQNNLAQKAVLGTLAGPMLVVHAQQEIQLTPSMRAQDNMPYQAALG